MRKAILYKFLTILVLVLTLIIIQLSMLNAQIRSRGLIDSITAANNGIWYNEAYTQFEIQLPKLQVVPPLSVEMDYETLLSYIYLDSLMRNANRDLIYINYLDRWLKKNTPNNDTVAQAIKYLYKLVDYNPVSFAQYDANLSASIYSLNTKSIRGWIDELLSSKIEQFEPSSQALKYLMQADYILKVRINSVDILPQRKYPPNKGFYQGDSVYRVTASVIDTLKGCAFPQCTIDAIVHNGKILQSVQSNICFTYVTGPYENNVYPFKVDPLLKNSAGNLKLQLGQELIVLLSLNSYQWDYNFDYFKLSLISVFPIINDQLLDISHIWSNHSTLSYEDWKLIFVQKKDKLLTGAY